MIRFKSSIIIEAPHEKVRITYLNYRNWDIIFPLTICGAKLIKQEGNALWIGVQHRTEGHVQNEIIMKDNSVILKEWKPKYTAAFYNYFEPLGCNTAYRVEAFIHLKGVFKLLQPFITIIAKHRVQTFVLIPLKNACENVFY